MFWPIQSAISQGILWGIMTLGVYITFRVLNFADLTVDGSFTLGGGISAILVANGMVPVMALPVAILGGMLAGLCTGLLTTKMRIPGLMASILTQIALYSINLRIMRSPNVPLLRIATMFTQAADLGVPARWVTLVIGILVAVLVMGIMYWFFGTEIGSSIRATGDNPDMVRAQGINTDTTTILALVLGNGLVALSGGLIAQQQGYADIGMGAGTIVVGLASIIIGEIVFPRSNFFFRLIGAVIGSAVYRVIIAFVLDWGMKPSDLKLFTAIVVALALFMPSLRSRLSLRWQKSANVRGKPHA